MLSAGATRLPGRSGTNRKGDHKGVGGFVLLEGNRLPEPKKSGWHRRLDRLESERRTFYRWRQRESPNDGEQYKTPSLPRLQLLRD